MQQNQFETTTIEAEGTTFAPVTTATEPLQADAMSETQTEVQAQAASSMQNAVNVSLETLLPRLRHLAERERRRRNLHEALKACLTFAFCIWAFHGEKGLSFSIFLYAILFSFLSSIVVGATVGPYFRARRSRDKRFVKELAGIQDARAIGLLAEALTLNDDDLKRVVREAMMQSLPLLQASDSALISPEQRGYLYKALYTMNADFVLALLKALEQVGDAKAIPYVEKLAAGEYTAKISKKVREEAKVCLEFLRQRAPHQEANETLLRAARSQAATPETLLRPAVSNSETLSEQLLRAANSSRTENDAP